MKARRDSSFLKVLNSFGIVCSLLGVFMILLSITLKEIRHYYVPTYTDSNGNIVVTVIRKEIEFKNRDLTYKPLFKVNKD